MPSIVTLTLNPSLDLSCSVGRVIPEEKLRCSRPTAQPGGGGLNVSRAIARLGGESTAIWACGGANGARIGQLLAEEGIGSLAVPIAAETRQNLAVYEEVSTQQYRFGFPGARMTSEEAEDCLRRLRALRDPDYVVLSGSLPPGVDASFYREAAACFPHSRVVVDTSGAALREAVQGRVFLLKPNLAELSALMGEDVLDDVAIVQASRRLIDGGHARAVVTSLGAGGVILVTDDRVEQVRAPTVPIRSKVGAGDSTVGGLVLALARGLPLPMAVRFGVAAGASAVSTPGTDLCRKGDTERLFAQLGGDAGQAPAIP